MCMKQRPLVKPTINVKHIYLVVIEPQTIFTRDDTFKLYAASEGNFRCNS